MAAVYIVSAGDLVKVGCSGHPPDRIHGIRSANGNRKSLAFVREFADKETSRQVEAISHYLLWRHRSVGEWFRVPLAVAIRAVVRADRLLCGNPTFEQFPRGLSSVDGRGDFAKAIARFKLRLRRLPSPATRQHGGAA